MRKTSAAFQAPLLLLIALANGCGGSSPPVSSPPTPAQVLTTVSIANPVDVAVNSATNRIYVASNGDGINPSTVTVIDGTTNLVIATVTVGPYPCAIVANPISNKIYVSDGTHSMTIIDGASNATQNISVSGGSSVCALAVDTTINRIYCLDGGTGTFTVIDGATNNVSVVGVSSANYWDSPSHLSINSATHNVYVSNRSRGGTSEVTAIDGATLQTSAVTLNGVPFSDYEVAANPSTNKIYVSGGELLAIIDGKTLSLQTITIGDSAGLIAVNSATDKIYFRSKRSAGSQDSVTVMDGSTLNTSVVPTGQNPAAIIVDEALNQVYVVNSDSGTVTVIDGASNATTTLAAGRSPGRSVLNPVTHRLYVTSFCSDVACGANGTVTVIEGAH